MKIKKSVFQYSLKEVLLENISIYKIIEKILIKSEKTKKMESVENFHLMFNKTPFAIFLIDMRGIIVDINKSSEKLFGYTKEELIGKNYLNFLNYSSEILSKFKLRYKKLLELEILDPIEIEVNKKDGIPIWVNALSMFIKLGENNYVQTIIQDITERKLLEQKLKESEEKFRTITEQSLMGIAIIQDDLIKYVNQQLRDLLGYSTEELKKWKPGAFANVIYPEDKGLVLEQARRKQMGLNGVITHYQYRLIKKTGEIIWVENYSKSIQYMGRPADLITIIDITKQKNAEEIIRKENIKYKHFLDTASHEFKTPLTSIYGATELLIKTHKDELSSEILELIEIAHHGSKKLKNLILNLLDVSRIEAGRFKLNKERINISNIVKECVNDLKYLIKRQQHLIHLDFPDEIYLNVDKVKIERVIMNLLSNAIKYTPPKGEITVNLLKNHSYIKINISDTGIGLTDTEIGKLFEKFNRIQRTSEEEEDLIMDGTGLGLYISKEIVELHGGKIYAKSEGKNKGSAFKVKFPIN